MDIYIAQIEWIPTNQGGRKTPPEAGYCPIIVTEGNTFDLQSDCWSIIIHDLQIVNTSKTICKIQYFSELAPQNLFPGAKFMLYEGLKLVATGIVLKKEVKSNIKA